MTEKRFEYHFDGFLVEWIIDNSDYERVSCKCAVELLNEFVEENEQLKKELRRLYNHFQDYLANEMSGEAFSEMWDFVKEDEKWD